MRQHLTAEPLMARYCGNPSRVLLIILNLLKTKFQSWCKSSRVSIPNEETNYQNHNHLVFHILNFMIENK